MIWVKRARFLPARGYHRVGRKANESWGCFSGTRGGIRPARQEGARLCERMFGVGQCMRKVESGEVEEKWLTGGQGETYGWKVTGQATSRKSLGIRSGESSGKSERKS